LKKKKGTEIIMAILEHLHDNQSLFLPEIAQRPQGRYVHYVMIRETESFPVFQTDGTLNVIPTQAGTKNEANAERFSRLVLFKRKQTSPERLTGRELLRLHGIISDDRDQERACVYNPTGKEDHWCRHCPDCIHYGYAIGDEGAEKSKVYVDSAFSITRYEDSHKSFHFNALYEHGTMTSKEETRSSFGEQDHIVPQVFFPAVVTLRDPTFEGFLYVLGNLLRTSRYGAQETRTGRVENHLVGITFTSGEIFSNLRFAQEMYQRLRDAEKMEHLPLERGAVLETAAEAVPALLGQEPVTQYQTFRGGDLDALLGEVRAIYQDDAQTKALLQELDNKTRTYASLYGAPPKKQGGAAKEQV
jgi:CRISPR-associated protein Csc2